MVKELVVYIDFRSANARLALNPTRRLAREIGVAIDWRPFSRKPKVRRTANPQSKGARHASVRAAYRRREREFYAEQQGIRLVNPDPEQETFVANAGVAWLRREYGAAASACDAYVGLTFERVWSGAMDPHDPAAVTAALAEAAGSADGFASYLRERAEADLEQHRTAALERCAPEVPAYIVAGEPYIGRAHLPTIRWLLAGENS